MIYFIKTKYNLLLVVMVTFSLTPINLGIKSKSPICFGVELEKESPISFGVLRKGSSLMGKGED